MATPSPLVGKTVATVTERDMVATNVYDDVKTYTETVITFTDGTTTTFALGDEELYSPAERHPEAPACGCGSTNVTCVLPGEWDCYDCGSWH